MLYFPVAAIVALFQLAASISLLKTGGKPSPFTYFVSTSEFIWFIISIVAIFTLDLSGWAFISPIMYVSYVITGFFYAASFTGQMDEAEELEIPRSYIFAGMGFSVLYGALNIFLYLDMA